MSLLKRMQDVQDQLLDHLNDLSPTLAAVLATFEEAFATMREAAAQLESFNKPGLTIPDDVKQAVALGAQFGNLMQRVKSHLDLATEIKTYP
jgi:ABC-type transporter Mla subunit MlaD